MSPRPGRTAASALLALLLPLIGLAGCTALGGGPGGPLTIESLTHDGQSLTGQFDTAVYSMDDRQNVTLVLYEGPLDAPRQAMTIRMFWHPRSGRTPIDASATNATVHYLVFADAQRSGEPGGRPGIRRVGVYAGAGFVYPRSGMGESTLRLEVWDADFRLSDRSDGFVDALGHGRLSGQFAARHDDAAVTELLNHFNRHVHAALGYPRLVAAPAQH